MQKKVNYKLSRSLVLAFLFLSPLLGCNGQPSSQIKQVTQIIKTPEQVTVGAARFKEYLPKLEQKKVAFVGNHTSLIGSTHVVDTLLSQKVNIVKIFSPEHGFRGKADAGENVKSGVDSKTGVPIVSLYGNNHKPKPEQLEGVEVVVFDMQDVGTRFYTYISTMTYVMEACAEQNIPVIVLDRPNPNGHFVDGPVLEDGFESFVGMHHVPVVHGMTIGEYAKMVNGEGWLKNGVKCELTVVTVENYAHTDLYQLPVNPSPNLPNMTAVYLYPSLCFFEGTIVSVGRGTDRPFQIIGYPDMPSGTMEFTPRSIEGAAKNPPYKGAKCMGFDLEEFGDIYIKNLGQLYFYWLLEAYKEAPDKEKFFNNYFNSLAGNSKMKQQIKEGKTEDAIRKSWEPELSEFKKLRKKYLLYKDFE